MWSKFKAQIIALWQKRWLGQIKLSDRDGWVGGKNGSWRGRRGNDQYGHHQIQPGLCFGQLPRLYGHHCFPPLPRTAGSYRADTLEICAIIVLSSVRNVYSNNQTYGVIPIDLYFPRARVINPTDRNVCDARNDRSRWLDLNLALITFGWSAPSSDLLISRRREPIINRLIVFLQSTPLIR